MSEQRRHPLNGIRRAGGGGKGQVQNVVFPLAAEDLRIQRLPGGVPSDGKAGLHRQNKQVINLIERAHPGRGALAQILTQGRGARLPQRRAEQKPGIFGERKAAAQALTGAQQQLAAGSAAR